MKAEVVKGSEIAGYNFLTKTVPLYWIGGISTLWDLYDLIIERFKFGGVWKSKFLLLNPGCPEIQGLFIDLELGV